MDKSKTHTIVRWVNSSDRSKLGKAKFLFGRLAEKFNLSREYVGSLDKATPRNPRNIGGT